MARISACTYDCPDACSFVVDHDAGGPLRVRGNPDHPFTRGRVCPKGASWPERLARSDRIVRPRLQTGGKLRDISWDAALSLVAGKIEALRATPEAMLLVHGHGYRGALATGSKRFFGQLGASAVRGSLCDEAGIEASLADFGTLAHNDPRDLGSASRIVLWGKDPASSSIHLAALIRQARDAGALVLAIGPGGDASTHLSDGRIRIRPGTDRFLAAWLCRRLLDEGRVPDRLAARAAGLPAFGRLLAKADPDALLAACGLPREAAQALFEFYAEPPVATLIGWGLQRHLHGGETVRFIDAACFLSGNVGLPGAGVYYNVSSSRYLADWADLLPAPETFARAFLLPDLAAELARAEPRVAFAWVDGTNVVNQVPDARAMASAFAAIDFSVCVDAFDNDTVRRASLVLPPSLAFEREDVMGSCLHHAVNHCAHLAEPPGEARSDYDILRDLGARLSPPVLLPEPEAVLARAIRVPGLSVSLAELRARGFAEADMPAVAFENLAFGHPDGRFHLPENLSPEPPADPDYPCRLLTLVRKEYIHSQIPPETQSGPPAAAAHPGTLAAAGLSGRATGHLATRLGRLPVSLVAEPDIVPGVVVVRRGGWLAQGHNPNVLIEPRLTDLGEGAAYYAQSCRLEE